MRRLISSQLYELIAATLGTSRDAATIAQGRGVRAARLRAIKHDIDTHLADSALSPSALARRQRISDSYMRKLFESEGTSFSDFVLRREVEPHGSFADKRVDHRPTVRTGIKRAILLLPVRQRQLCRIAEYEIDFLPDW